MSTLACVSAVARTRRHSRSNDKCEHSTDLMPVNHLSTPPFLLQAYPTGGNRSCQVRPNLLSERGSTISSRSHRNEVDIKGHDGVIYKGRLDTDKLPPVEVHKKHSTNLLAPLQRSRSDVHTLPHPHSNQHDLSGSSQERNELSPLIPNLEPALPREESYT